MDVFILSARNADLYSLANITQVCRLHLIASPEQIRAMKPESKGFFRSIIEAPEEFDPESKVYRFSTGNLATEIRSCIHGKPEDARLLCNQEANLVTAAELRELTNIPGPRRKDILPFRDKVLMKQQLKNMDAYLPRYIDMSGIDNIDDPERLFDRLKMELGVPILLKPKSSVGSRGVFIVRTADDMRQVVKTEGQALASYEADEFVNGLLFHCDSVVANGKIVFSECSRYSCPNLDLQFGKNLGSLAMDSTDPLAIMLKEFSKKILAEFSLIDSAYHMEIFIRQDGSPVFLEVAARVPGLGTIPVYKTKYGKNMLDLEFRVQTGLEFSSVIESRASGSFFMVFPKKTGKIRAIRDLPIKSPYSIDWKVKTGDNILNTTTNIDYAGIAIVAGDKVQIEEDFASLFSFSPLQME